MIMHVQPDGSVLCLYGEELDLTAFGSLSIQRASHVEPDAAGLWQADLSPVGGPLLGPFVKRSLALQAETEWLNSHYLPHQ